MKGCDKMALTKDQKNGTLALKENTEMKSCTKTKEELREFANSEELYTIRELREHLGLSQRKFAEKYGIPRRTVEDWDRGLGNQDSWAIKLLNRVVKEDVKSDLRYNRI